MPNGNETVQFAIMFRENSQPFLSLDSISVRFRRFPKSHRQGPPAGAIRHPPPAIRRNIQTPDGNQVIPVIAFVSPFIPACQRYQLKMFRPALQPKPKPRSATTIQALPSIPIPNCTNHHPCYRSPPTAILRAPLPFVDSTQS